MRRILTLLLAITLFCVSSAFAESNQMETADIQEMVITREDPEYTLEEQVSGLMDAFHSEEFRDLLNIRDVQEVLHMVITGVGQWLIENRATTMKILNELGVSEHEQEMVSLIWDSGERAAEYVHLYEATENGQKPKAELQTLGSSPVWKDTVSDFIRLGTSEDVQKIVDFLVSYLVRQALETSEEYSESEETVESETAEDHLADKLLDDLLSIIESSEWAKNSLPRLIGSDLFQNTAKDLIRAMLADELKPARLELISLQTNPEVIHFFSRIVMTTVKSAAQTVPDEFMGGNSNE